MARWILGDVHARIDALEQVFERAKFQEDDLLISIGDIVDRGHEPFECVEFLSKIKNKVLIRGNHDEYFYDYIRGGKHKLINDHGTAITLMKYRPLSVEMKIEVEKFFSQQVYYYILEDKCFVHGGFDRNFSIKTQDSDTLIWDRELWSEAMKSQVGDRLEFEDGFKTIFIGHTPTIAFNSDKPLFYGGVWNVDTGAGFNDGKMTLLNIDTFDYFQSDTIGTI